MSPATIPVVDLSPWSTPGSSSAEDRIRVSYELVKACHDNGFVYIRNHGVPEARVGEGFQWMHKFFALPEDKKMAVARPVDSNSFRGYQKVGAERTLPIEGEKRADVPDHNESYALGHDNYDLMPNIWLPEDSLPGFREFMTAFYFSCWSSAVLILRALAVGLDLDEEFLLAYHDETLHELAIRHYPSIRAQVVEDGQTDRLGAHTDFDSFTMLWQDSAGGLQVKTASTGVWTDAPPLEDAVLMNIGDVLERWSNGKLQSTLHRVHLPPCEDSFRKSNGVRMTNERFSMPFFIAPKFESSMKPLKGDGGNSSSSEESFTYKQLYEEKMSQMEFS